jgi:hypothetical protein
MSRVDGNASRVSAAEQKRRTFLEAVKAGKTNIEAAHLAGWGSDVNYYQARRTHKDWAAEVDHARQVARGEREPSTFTGTPPDFGSFVGKYFPDRRPHLPHQLRIVDELQQLRPREVCMFLIWPEAGKTATLEDYLCRKLAFDPEHRFRIVSEAGDLSKRIVGTCSRRFTDTSEYGEFIARYGPFYQKGQERQGKPWTTEQLTIWKNSGHERDRSLVASSWTSAVYGSRIDTLILDDLQSQRNYNQSEEIFRRIRGTFFNRGIEMRTLIVGTRIGPGDFYDRMLDAGLVTKQVIIPAADVDGNPKVPAYWDRPNVIHDGGPCCMGFRECPRNGEKLTPREFMELIRHQSGEETWHASYQQNPTANERSTFAQYIDKCLDHDRTYGPLKATA